MASSPRIVAELGRPETPQETADRKAASSAAYRASKTNRNLIAALLVTLALVAVIIFAVPRGEMPAREPIDVAAIAADVSDAEGRAVLVPDGAEDWVVNSARIDADDVRAWTIVYAPEKGYFRVAQGFDADEAWPARVLGGASATDTVTIDGVTWDRYDITDLERSGNISVALVTTAGPDTVMIYGGGGLEDDVLEQAATSVADQVIALQEDAE